MNIVEYNNTDDRELVFCILDTTAKITDPWIKELTKNQADFTLQNLFAMGYTVLQCTSGDLLLQDATTLFKHTCILSTGTQFTNCSSQEVIKVITTRKNRYLFTNLPF